MGKITYYGQAVHYETIPCGVVSIFGLIISKDKAEVTCKTCLRCIGGKRNEGHRRSHFQGSKRDTDKT